MAYLFFARVRFAKHHWLYTPLTTNLKIGGLSEKGMWEMGLICRKIENYQGNLVLDEGNKGDFMNVYLSSEECMIPLFF